MANILLVDDDKDVLIMAQRILETQNHRVFSTQDALSAMEMLEEHSIDVLISDANMPLFSGFDLVKLLRKDERYQNMALIMLTGRRTKEDIEKAIRLRIDGYIVKPTEPMTFIQKVESVLTRRPLEKKKGFEILASSPIAAGSIRTKIRLLSITEESLTFRTQEPVALHSRIDINCNLFNELSIHAPPLQVISCVPNETENSWEIIVSYVGMKETHVQRIRKWIASQTKNMREAA